VSGRRVCVIGTGLIGASVGLGLRAIGDRVTGWDPDPAELELALDKGALDGIADSRDGALDGADVIVLAAPAGAVIDILGSLETDALVTDVAGVKGPVIAAAAHLERFVGGHPMAGREQRGAGAASAALFRGAAWVITTDGAAQSAVDDVAGLAADLGALPTPMTAAEHDRAVAVISHLPQVLAGALLEAAAGVPHALELAAGSFRDLTRVAASDPSTWVDVLVANAANLGGAAEDLTDRLAEWSAVAGAGEVARLETAMSSARSTRRGLSPPVVPVAVALEDRPGELALVGEALASSGVDVRDLQLRHGIHGGGGILTLSVRPGEAEALSDALRSAGLSVLRG